ncbi:glycosyltransferase family 4 protein [Thalassoglobus sp.]|uniref:glycosyltransferase family 4 protein n=1 Tax=Thalassoglobus sp. TaxID=2795869 RepID=UPI003AA8179E
MATKAIDLLFILGSFELRGRYQRSMSLIQALPEDAVKIRVLSATPPPSLAEKIGRNSIYVDPYLQVPILSRISARFTKREYLKNRPDLIDIQHRHMHQLGAWLAQEIETPYVLHLQDIPPADGQFEVDLRWCRRIITVSDSIRQQLLNQTGLPEELVSVVQNGVNIPREEDLQPILPEDRPPVIGTAGPLEKEKGLNHFLWAAKAILEKHPEVLFLIAGSGPEEKSLRQLAEELKISQSLTILPHLENFRQVFQAIDLFVLPELRQGSKLILLEAMAAGLPVVSSDIDGVAHIVDDGVTGLLVPAADVEELSSKLHELLIHRHQAREIGRLGRDHIRENFLASKMTESMLSIYQEILKTKQPPA